MNMKLHNINFSYEMIKFLGKNNAYVEDTHEIWIHINPHQNLMHVRLHHLTRLYELLGINIPSIQLSKLSTSSFVFIVYIFSIVSCHRSSTGLFYITSSNQNASSEGNCILNEFSFLTLPANNL